MVHKIKKKVAVIGLDGMPWQILNRLFNQGIMPNLKKVAHQGARGILKSTIPPYTSASWTSIATGVNPGKHGVFDFRSFYNNYGVKLTNGMDVMRPRLHELMMLNGFRIVLVNLPHSYPFIKSNKSVIITDWLTPKLIIYPDSVKHLVSSYTLDWDMNDCLSQLEGRINTVTNLLENVEWDLSFVVFSDTDWIMHMAYGAIIHYHKNVTLKVHKLFNLIDKFIGKIISQLEEKDLLVVLSDHGFKTYDKIIYINTLLSKTGLISKRMARRDALKKQSWVDRGIRGPKNIPIPHWLFQIINRSSTTRKISSRISKLAFGNKIEFQSQYSFDFLPSRAFALSRSSFGIYINSKSMFKTGIVESVEETELVNSLMKLLSTVRDPVTGDHLFSYVAKRDEVYWGPHVKRAPHVVFLPNMNKGYNYIANRPLFTESIIRGPRATHFAHSMYGVLILYGADVLNNAEIGTANTYDLVPTVLHYLDLPIPHDTDGKTLSNMFHEGSDVHRRSVKSRNYLEHWKIARGKSLVEENDAKVGERLTILGYL